MTQTETSDLRGETKWSVWRMDDNGNTFLVHQHLSHDEAETLARQYESLGHK